VLKFVTNAIEQSMTGADCPIFPSDISQAAILKRLNESEGLGCFAPDELASIISKLSPTSTSSENQEWRGKPLY
jgi:hypothetical protein